MNVPPTIDISYLMTGSEPHAGLHHGDVAAQVSSACRDIGFLTVVGHGIPLDLIRQLRHLTIGLFGQPLDAKRNLQISKDNYRGYIPLNFFTPNASGQNPDGYEGYKLHAQVSADDPVVAECSLYGPNKWPDFPSELRQVVQAYWQHCDRISEALLHVLLVQSGVDTAFVPKAFAQPLTNMTLLHYPAATPAPGQSVIGIHPHKDTDVLTILAPDPVGGLEIKTRSSGEWIAVEAPDDGLIINIGDMLELWSGGHYVSTPHRVNNVSGKDRYSFPYFSVPRHDVVVESLCSPKQDFDRVPMCVGDVSRKIWQSNWPDSSPVETCYDPAIR